MFMNSESGGGNRRCSTSITTCDERRSGVSAFETKFVVATECACEAPQLGPEERQELRMSDLLPADRRPGYSSAA